MTKAEERALEEYPQLAAEHMGCKTLQPMKRAIYKNGYEQAQKDLGWISVKETLPEENGLYFTNTKYGQLGISNYLPVYGWFDDEGYDVTVDYWMPIPELPKNK